MTELYRTGDKSLTDSILFNIIFDLFLGGKLSSGSGDSDGAGETGFELGGVSIGSAFDAISSTARAASTHFLMSSPALIAGSYCTAEK